MRASRSRVAQEFEDIAVECIGTGLGNYADLASAELAVFRVEVTGENAELGDGIQVGNDRRAHVDVFFDVAAIQHEAVGELPLAVDGDGAGVQIAGGRKCADSHILSRAGCERRDGRDAGLKGEQVRVAASIERHRGHLFACDDFTQLRIGCLDMRGRFGDGHGLGSLSDFERRVHHHLAVDIDRHAGTPQRLKPRSFHFDVVAAYCQALKCVEAPAIGGDGLLHGGGRLGRRDPRARNGRPTGVCNGSQQGPPSPAHEDEPNRERIPIPIHRSTLQLSCIRNDRILHSDGFMKGPTSNSVAIRIERQNLRDERTDGGGPGLRPYGFTTILVLGTPVIFPARSAGCCTQEEDAASG